MSAFVKEPQASSAQFKSFVSETELNDRRAKRQEEWDKVRNADQPLEAPEEEYDPRSLFERLQAHKDKKQAEYEEAHKLKNMIKGLDNDEVQFLDLVDKTKEEMEAKILKEEGREIEEYRRAVATLAEEADTQKRQDMKNASGSILTPPVVTTAVTQSSSQRRSQLSLLAGAVKRKSTDKAEEDVINKSGDEASKKLKTDDSEKLTPSSSPEINEAPSSAGVVCLGVLPGLGVYSDSSDSEGTSGSEVDMAPDHYDLLGRPRWLNREHVPEKAQGASKV